MSKLRELAYRIDPVPWVHSALGVEPDAWQAEFLRAPLGASIVALTARQVGKTTTASWAIAHCMLFSANSLSVIACPALRQSAEAVRRVREILVKVGATLSTDNVYALELKNGSRVLALPGSDDLIRGLTVDGWIVADEAARLSPDLIAALGPMRARRPRGALCHAVDGMEHEPIRSGLFGRSGSFMDPAEGDRRGCRFFLGGIFAAAASHPGRSQFSARVFRDSPRRRSQPVQMGIVRPCHPDPDAAGGGGSGLWATH